MSGVYESETRVSEMPHHCVVRRDDAYAYKMLLCSSEELRARIFVRERKLGLTGDWVIVLALHVTTSLNEQNEQNRIKVAERNER